MDFKLVSNFKPIPDQKKSIGQLVQGLNANERHLTLAGLTGTGKTFTMANVIQEVQRPTLILTHNKTLVAQLYQEFKDFFPNNKVEYFVSHFDYFQPESFIPATNKYIQKDSRINEELNRLRLSAISSLKSGRRDVIVVSSVSCIYGAGNPKVFEANIFHIHKGMKIGMKEFALKLVKILYSRNDMEPKFGTFKVKGDTIFITLASADCVYRIIFDDDSIEDISIVNRVTNTVVNKSETGSIYPAYMFLQSDNQDEMLAEIQKDLDAQVKYFLSQNMTIEATRLQQRVGEDIQMIKEIGHCFGMENYSRYIDGRKPGERAYCLMDYFPKDYLMIMDESHVTQSQLRAMYFGDRSRKEVLIDNGFRLPASFDARPLKFQEFEEIINQIIFVSATPSDYELRLSEGVIVEQLNRPTGIVEPKIEVKPNTSPFMIDDLLEQLHNSVRDNLRVLITTLTKDEAENLSSHLENLHYKVRYMHSEIKTLERMEILYQLRSGMIDIVVGVNLLREGLDLPEVGLVVILDADKEGFLRSYESLTQTMGRAARNAKGRVIFYADKITGSMKKTIDEADRRRKLQIAYNKVNGIIPSNIIKGPISRTTLKKEDDIKAALEKVALNKTDVRKKSEGEIMDEIKKVEKQMMVAAKNLDFIEAAMLRDHMKMMKQVLVEKA